MCNYDLVFPAAASSATTGSAQLFDHVLRLQRRREPVARSLAVRHVNLQASVLTQQNERRALVAAAGVTNHHHVLNLGRNSILSLIISVFILLSLNFSLSASAE